MRIKIFNINRWLGFDLQQGLHVLLDKDILKRAVKSVFANHDLVIDIKFLQQRGKHLYETFLAINDRRAPRVIFERVVRNFRILYQGGFDIAREKNSGA